MNTIDIRRKIMNGGMIGMIAIYAVIIGLVYLFLLRPNSKKKKQEAEMRNNLEIGDEITTIGGIVGRVVAIKDEEDALIIETGSDRVKMKFKKWCISSVDTVKETTPAPEKKSFFSGFGKKKQSAEAKEEQNA